MNTPFQQALQQVKDGTLQAPKVSVSGGELDSCWGYFDEDIAIEEAKGIIDSYISQENN